VITTIFTVSIGIYFYLFTPEFYIKYVLGNYDGLINDSDSIFMARLLSYFGDPTVMGNISVISLPIFIYIVRLKESPFTSKLLNTVCFIILICGVLLSFARSAWVACVLYLFYLILIDNKNIFMRVISFFFIASVAIALIFLANLNFDNPILGELQKRIFSMGGSFDERNSQIEYAFGLIKSSPQGIGLGQAGHKSVLGVESLGVFDNNYLRIFAELGIIGFLSFLLLIGFSLYLGLRKSRDKKINSIRILVLIVLLVFYFQSIGSNILDLHYSSFLFWSFLGILSWSYKYEPIIK
jgi:O-antigen ligase